MVEGFEAGVTTAHLGSDYLVVQDRIRALKPAGLKASVKGGLLVKDVTLDYLKSVLSIMHLKYVRLNRFDSSHQINLIWRILIAR